MQSNEEIWKDIPGYEGLYQASNKGRIKSLPRAKVKEERIRKSSVDSTGYLSLCLVSGSPIKYRTEKVHVLVAMAFKGHKSGNRKVVINHIDTNRLNNNDWNLEITSARENTSRKHIPHSSKYVGVSWSEKAKKWIASINIKGKRFHLGCFENEFDAHQSYQKAVPELNDKIGDK